jgi:hypothetical protein
MLANPLQAVADSVVRRAQRQGYVVPRDIRLELKQAGLPAEQWKDVVNLARASLNYRQGRYYHISALSPRLQQEQLQQRQIQRAIRRLIRRYQATVRLKERRQQDRIDFIQPVQVHAEDGRSFTLLSRDLSTTGIRLIGTRRLLGQKVRVELPQGDDSQPCTFVVRVLWTCAIGDDMFENGGAFLELVAAE